MSGLEMATRVLVVSVEVYRVRQGCSLSPLIYLIYDEAMIKEAFDVTQYGVMVSGEVINSIRYGMQMIKQWCRV